MLACKNRNLAKRGVTQSGGRNEKPRQHWCVAGYPLLLTASFASILGGEGGIRTRGTVVPYTRFPGVHLKPLGHLSVWEGRRVAKNP